MIREIKSGRIRWAAHAERMEDNRNACKFSWANLKKSDHLEDRGLGWKIMLRRNLVEQNGRAYT